MPSTDHVQADVSGRKAAAAIIVGSALEWYDFYVYASMAALVFGSVFFPSGNEAAATLASFATLSVGFFARPFGGIVFGALGDRIGRKRVLSMTFVLMGLASGAIGLLPGYASIGLAAPVLLVLLRFVQGLAAGSELSSAIAFSYEYAGEGAKGRIASWPALGTSVGLLASSVTVAVLASFGDEFLRTWGWRIPFWLAFSLVAIGYLIRRQLPETPEFEQHAARRPVERRRPVRDLVAHHRGGLLVVLVASIGHNATSYMFKTFSLTYLTTFLDLPASVGALGITLASIVALFAVPVAGRMSDRFGSRATLMGGGVALCLLAFPFFWMVDTRTDLGVWVALILTVGVVVPANLASQGSFMARQFPVEVRNAGIGTGREIGGALGGGLAPLAAVGILTVSSEATWAVSLLFLASGLLIVVAAAADRSSGVERQDRLAGAVSTAD